MTSTVAFPRMFRVRQKFPPSPRLHIPAVLREQFEASKVLQRLKPGARLAVAVGSRGITNLQTIVRSVIDLLKAAGAQPFIVPAMGSHGGATPDGQTGLLAEYGVTEAGVGAPVRASMEVKEIGVSEDGVRVLFSVEALRADGIVVINRVKPHTDFQGTLGSGVLKMIVIGLGKHAGAATCHAAATRLGYERVLRGVARVSLQRAPILCGVGIVEDQFHQTARLAVLPREEIEDQEKELFEDARARMPRLPFEDIDFLIIDRIGKNISGSGMDPNVTGRWVHGYSSALVNEGNAKPFVRRIFVRDVTPETHGNAIGIGFADFTTTRLVRAMDRQVTYINSLTSLTPNGVKIPMYFDTDREVLAAGLTSLALADTRAARIVRIADTLSLATLEASEPYLSEVRGRADLEVLGEPEEFQFAPDGNLAQVGS
jgi:hypothetical protein